MVPDVNNFTFRKPCRIFCLNEQRNRLPLVNSIDDLALLRGNAIDAIAECVEASTRTVDPTPGKARVIAEKLVKENGRK